MNEHTSLAWAAGFIDGEGHISLRFRKGKGGCYTPDAKVEVTNTSLESLLALNKVLFGFGRISSPGETRPRHKDLFRLRIGKMINIVKVLYSLMPYMVTKRAVAEQVLAYCISRSSGGIARGRHKPITENELRMIKRVQALNRKGI